MKVQLELITQDPATVSGRGIEGFRTEKQEYFLDGPVCRRVAVIDFDRDGTLVPGAVFVPPREGRKLGRYAVRDRTDLRSRDLNQVSVFSTVLQTIYMFEDEDALGRAIRWAFDAAQLLVVPRAGRRANAFYERDSHSLQFFYFDSKCTPGTDVYSSLSHDIVAHETGHAILDGIAPDLYNAVSPQSLALHEGIADLVAVVMAFRSHSLAKLVLDRTGGSIREASAFSWLAEEFGRAKYSDGRRQYLRSLLNDKTLDPWDNSKDENGEWNQVPRDKPHVLSQVLSGALFTVMVKLHEKLKQQLAEKEGRSEFSVSGKALFVAAERFKRLLIRALDYLPPGEVSFADYGRAILASDQASHPGDDEARRWIREEFERRYMAESESESESDLEVETELEHPSISALDLATLVESDWAAYDFANRNRELLGIPPDVPFQVRPRLDVTKLYYLEGGEQRVRECIFKVSWYARESNRLRRAGFPTDRQITAGTTLAIDWESRRIRLLLRSDVARLGEADAQREDRDAMLERMLDEGVLQLDEERRPGVPWAESNGELMRVRRSANPLHVTEDATDSSGVAPAGLDLKPPAGVDAGAFFHLVRCLRSQAANHPTGT